MLNKSLQVSYFAIYEYFLTFDKIPFPFTTIFLQQLVRVKVPIYTI